MKKIKKITDVFYKILFAFLLATAGLAALSAFGLPKSFRLFVVQSGSMEPAIKRGSLVIVQPQKQYQKDEIITFKSRPDADIKNPGLLITHRIVDIKDDNGGVFFTTKGDANESPDMDTRPTGSVLGKVVFTISYLGYPVGFAKTQTGFILLIVVPATIIVYSELLTIKNEALRLVRERKKRKLTTKEKVEKKIGEEIIAVEKDVMKVEKELGNALEGKKSRKVGKA